MEVTIQRIERTEIHLDFVQDIEMGMDDVTPLYTSLSKIRKIVNAPGFKNDFTSDERGLWESIFKQILKDEGKAEGNSSIGGGPLYVNKD